MQRPALGTASQFRGRLYAPALITRSAPRLPHGIVVGHIGLHGDIAKVLIVVVCMADEECNHTGEQFVVLEAFACPIGAPAIALLVVYALERLHLFDEVPRMDNDLVGL